MASHVRDYYIDHYYKPFDWQTNHCLRFVNGYLVSIGEKPLPEEWLVGYDTPKKAVRVYLKCLMDFGYEDIIEAIDDRFYRELTLHPEDGMICARKEDSAMGWAFGITYMQQPVFLTEIGARAVPVEPGDLFWSIE